MAPPKGTKRKSDESLSAPSQDEGADGVTATPRTTIRSDTPDSQHPQKKKRRGVTLAQKQALVDNLQLEITERARKLRAQYNLQAQGLRTRIEIRVNRIPGALRKAKMGDLADKYKNGQHPQQAKAASSAALPSAPCAASRPPPVPEKDNPRPRPDASRSTAATTALPTALPTASPLRPARGRSPQKARCGLAKPRSQGLPCANMSSEGALGHKRNNGGETADLKASPRKKRIESTRTASVLSPSSANIRHLPKHTPVCKSFSVMRPTPSTENIRNPLKSPTKQLSTPKFLNTLADKGHSARKDNGTRRFDAPTPRAAHLGSIMMSNKKPVVASAQKVTKGAPVARTRQRGSDASESTASSTSIVTRKTAKKVNIRNGVLGPTKRGAAGAGVTKKTATSKTTGTTTATGRSLRNRV
ncbi:Borealin N terminal-domain-containing protein [Coniella lustricola]|uniref:Borealin N terminal-domain-containing protein n=1 Tax=Coniella lustricola TaxID=2025994 RepID=A0A2T3AIY4_9PEZI|nr:Borealin N terminal-domain-containing protein [Coniella lustricola]